MGQVVSVKNVNGLNLHSPIAFFCGFFVVAEQPRRRRIHVRPGMVDGSTDFGRRFRVSSSVKSAPVGRNLPCAVNRVLLRILAGVLRGVRRARLLSGLLRAARARRLLLLARILQLERQPDPLHHLQRGVPTCRRTSHLIGWAESVSVVTVGRQLDRSSDALSCVYSASSRSARATDRRDPSGAPPTFRCDYIRSLAVGCAAQW